MTNTIFAILLVTVALAGCSSTPKQDVDNTRELSGEITVKHEGPSLFQEAHRCQGVVKYQAEMQKGQMRSRLSCEWQVQPDEWGTW